MSSTGILLVYAVYLICKSCVDTLRHYMGTEGIPHRRCTDKDQEALNEHTVTLISHRATTSMLKCMDILIMSIIN